MAFSGVADPSTSRMKKSSTALDSEAASRASLSRRPASVPARVARTACHVLTAVPATRARPTNAAVVRAARLRRAYFAEPIPGRRRARLHRPVGQVPHHVGGEVVGRLVPPPSVLLQRLHHDPVELAPHGAVEPPRVGPPPGRDGRERLPQGAEPRAGLRRLLLADDPPHLVERRLAERLAVERRAAGQQLVEQDAQGVDVAAGVHVGRREVGLLGAHVQRRADELVEAGEQRPLGEAPAGGLGDAEVDDLGDGHAVDDGHQHVGGLQVAVDDPLLVGVLHGPADQDEQLQPLGDRKVLAVAVVGDRQAADQLHHEVGPPRRRWCRRRGPGRCWGGPSGPAPAARPRTGRSPAGSPCRA